MFVAVIELFSQLAALLVSIGPVYTVSAAKIIPFINPKIVEDMWIVTSLVSAVSGLVVFNIKSASGYLALVSLILCIISILGLLSLTQGLFSVSPAVAAFLVRALFLLFFVALAISSGWATARILQRLRHQEVRPH